MTDDLIKKLRKPMDGVYGFAEHYDEQRSEAADRIEELEEGFDLALLAYRRQHEHIKKLETAAFQLYMAGKWDCDTLEDDEQTRLWTNLRNALGLPEGTATKAGLIKGTNDEG